jgi:putative Holliday junction resolvase
MTHSENSKPGRVGYSLLGFDFGTKKIGIAVGQTVTGSATPLETLFWRNGKPDWEGIGRLIGTWQPQALVVGMPYNEDGDEEDWAAAIHRFARQLEGRYHLPVHKVDEGLTSMEARSRLGLKASSREIVDAVAAKLILETWLSEHHQ